MILPIQLYGSRILRERARPVEGPSEALSTLVGDMVETMHAASGIGLAAPQVGRTERVFVVDLRPLAEDFIEETGEVPDYARGPLVFINPELAEVDGAEITPYEEGCLSIPDIRERVERPVSVHIRYLDADFQPRELSAEGMFARVLQHEYDHLEGVLFIDRISPLRRRLLQRRLRAIARGEAEADYEVAWDGGGLGE
jgi:peptide deformylase